MVVAPHFAFAMDPSFVSSLSVRSSHRSQSIRGALDPRRADLDGARRPECSARRRGAARAGADAGRWRGKRASSARLRDLLFRRLCYGDRSPEGASGAGGRSCCRAGSEDECAWHAPGRCLMLRLRGRVMRNVTPTGVRMCLFLFFQPDRYVIGVGGDRRGCETHGLSLSLGAFEVAPDP
jgi:hypothetical protein